MRNSATARGVALHWKCSVGPKISSCGFNHVNSVTGSCWNAVAARFGENAAKMASAARPVPVQQAQVRV